MSNILLHRHASGNARQHFPDQAPAGRDSNARLALLSRSGFFPMILKLGRNEMLGGLEGEVNVGNSSNVVGLSEDLHKTAWTSGWKNSER
jgi:hypothetical protein